MSTMESELHFVLIPLMSPGHLLPMVDMARLLANHGVTVSIVTTPLNSLRFNSSIKRAVDSGLRIRILHLQFPATEFGLPEGCENMDQLPSRELIKNFFMAAGMLQQRFEELFDELKPKPSCIISGKNLPWTVKTALKFKIPRIFFDGMGCFSFACTHNLEVSKLHETISKLDQSFIVPGLPHKIELKKAQLPENLNTSSNNLINNMRDIRATDLTCDGIVVNTFEELENEYVKEYKKVKGDDKVWCIGPVSGINKLSSDKAERGGEMESDCLKAWLDSKEPDSVIYACLGSISGLTKDQLVELGLGLESSKQPFIWVIRKGSQKSKELEKWILEEGFEDRIKDRGLIIRGWAPQLWILSHPSIGAFLTHCGWNSITEAVTAGVPIITCPLFAEQFINERLVVDVLGIGVSVGVEAAVTWGLEDKLLVLLMKREGVKKAIEKAMEKNEIGGERRRKAKQLGEIANKAIDKGGSSYHNMEMLIQFVLQRTREVTQTNRLCSDFGDF